MKKLFVSIVLFAVASLVAGEVVVANTSAGDIKKDDLKQMYLGKKKKWGDGKKVVLTTLKSGAEHKSFMKNVVSKSPSQFKTFWKKLVFTGKGTMPKEFSSDAELLAFIAAHPGAIGYISEGSKGRLPTGVTVLSVK